MTHRNWFLQVNSSKLIFSSWLIEIDFYKFADRHWFWQVNSLKLIFIFTYWLIWFYKSTHWNWFWRVDYKSNFQKYLSQTKNILRKKLLCWTKIRLFQQFQVYLFVNFKNLSKNLCCALSFMLQILWNFWSKILYTQLFVLTPIDKVTTLEAPSRRESLSRNRTMGVGIKINNNWIRLLLEHMMEKRWGT